MTFIQMNKPLQECVMLYGIRGCGKTELLKYLIRSYDNEGIRTLVFDTMHNHRYKLKHGGIIKPQFAQKEEAFLKACNHVWKEGNMVFAIEEVDQYCKPQWLHPELDSIVNVGRNRGIGYIATTRRIADVHKDVIANCEHHFIFKAFLPRDLEEYQKYVGKLVWQAKDLAPYHFIYYKVGGTPQICRPIPLRN